MQFQKQGEYTKKATDLGDVPSQNMPPSEIKQYFQTSADEIRDTFNTLVDGLNSSGWVDSNKLAPKGVQRANIAPGSIGTSEIDPAIINQPNTLIGAQAQLQQVNDQLGDIAVNVRTFGAIGDGVTDDSQAFNNAIAYAKANNIRKIFAPSRYLINSTINLTELKTNGITIEGVHQAYEYGVGSELILNTGGVGIDCTGSSRVRFRNLKITSRTPGLSNPSKIGILFARSLNYSYADRCALDTCYVDMVSDYSANGGVGTIGVYNYAAEIFKIGTCEIKADLPAVFTQNNIYNVKSLLTTVVSPNGINTMTSIDVRETIFTSRYNYAIALENLGEGTFKINADCYPSDGRTKGTAVFKMLNDFNKNIKVEDIHSELFNKFIEIDGKLDFFSFTGLVSGLTDRAIDMTTNTSRIRYGRIDLLVSIDRSLYPTGTTALIYNPFSGDYQIASIDLTLGSLSKIDAANQRFTSCNINSDQLASDVVINVSNTSTYNLTCWDGVPSALLKSAAQQTVATGTYTKLTFDTVESNVGGMYSSSQSDRITVKKPGLYMIQTGVNISTSVTGTVLLSILKSGTLASENRVMSGFNPKLNMMAIARCNVNDVIQIELWHNNTSSITTEANNVNVRVVRIAP